MYKIETQMNFMDPLISKQRAGELISIDEGDEVLYRVYSNQTDGLFELFERQVPPHSIAADPHIHRTSTETFYVLEGRASILCGDVAAQYEQGSVVSVPKNVVHGYANHTDYTIRVLSMYTPAIGNEEFFRGMGLLKHGPKESFQDGVDALRSKFDSLSVKTPFPAPVSDKVLQAKVWEFPRGVFISGRGDGTIFPMEPGSLVRFKILSRDTEELIEMYERELPPHMIGADPHIHKSTTETFYVLEGQPTILCGEDASEYGPGDVVVVPPNTVHAYFNDSDTPVKVLILFTPGLGHDGFFRELSKLKHGPPNTYQRDLNSLRERFDSISVSLD
jgi:quercetin dioxygenase-like cupin family protein